MVTPLEFCRGISRPGNRYHLTFSQLCVIRATLKEKNITSTLILSWYYIPYSCMRKWFTPTCVFEKRHFVLYLAKSSPCLILVDGACRDYSELCWNDLSFNSKQTNDVTFSPSRNIIMGFMLEFTEGRSSCLNFVAGAVFRTVDKVYYSSLYALRPRSHVTDYSQKRTIFSPYLKKIRVHTDRICTSTRTRKENKKRF